MLNLRPGGLERFLFVDGWFSRQFAAKSASRFPTFKTALNLFLQRGLKTIVETGCVRLRHDWGAGYSTVLFANFVREHGGHVWTVDMDAAHMELCREVTQEFREHITYLVSDSVAFFESIGSAEQLQANPGLTQIDLLYLDSLDYPIRPEDGPIGPSQRHCLNELRAALPRLSRGSIVLIDDNDLPGGGKPALAKRLLLELGWTCLFDSQQTLWILE